MRRTQLYLDDQLWNALHVRARSEGTTISELVRVAARDRYLGKLGDRAEAMRAFVGIRKDQPDSPGAVEQVRRMRRGSRLKRLLAK